MSREKIEHDTSDNGEMELDCMRMEKKEEET